MKLRVPLVLTAVSGWLFTFPGVLAAAASWQMTIQADKPSAKINPGFYGLMTEEINHSYDGGLYAELIRNRAFKDNDREPFQWSMVQEDGGAGTMALDHTEPLNTSLDVSLRVDVTAGGGRVGVANAGYWGIPVKPDTAYQISFYARSAGTAGPLTASLESGDGQTKYAQATFDAAPTTWKKYWAELKTGHEVTPGVKNRLVISTDQPGTVWLSFVSLFPPTYKNRANGNRVDLMEKLAGLKPSFLRFPGGNYVDPGHYEWKKTIGPVEGRPGSPGAWKYRVSEGLGLLEFFLWCEDLGMEPLLAVTDGRSWLPANGDVAPLVQDALDEIEYATGDVKTPWGARRAADGHPAPFKLRYVEIGNEDFFDRRATYEARFAKFFDAIRAKYPALKLIATRRDMQARVPDLIDDHLYANAPTMARAGAKYDQYDRKAPKVFVGEWATQDGNPTPTLRGALGDAAYLTGLERNADVIEMACYAPLLANVNPRATQWPTNLIGYDALTSFGSPSYYMQQMFARNKGDVALPVSLRPGEVPAAEEAPHGGVGVGTYQTQAEFKDAQVTAGNAPLFSSGDAMQPDDWKTPRGKWSVQEDGSYRQSDNQQFSRALTKVGGDWTDYTYTVKARKLGGQEGFLIYFRVKDDRNYVFWNVGGWGNARSGLEQTIDETKEEIGTTEDVKVETGRWYELSIEVKGQSVRCYLDGALVTQATLTAQATKLPLYTSATRDNATNDLILKVVNLGDGPQKIQVNVAGVARIGASASEEVLTGNPDTVNSVAEPTKIAPVQKTISTAGKNFEHEFPGNSVTVLRLKTR